MEPPEHPFKAYRAAKSLSQEELGALLGVSRGMISLIEIGARPINAKKARDWEVLTGIPKERLCPEVFGEQAA